MKAQFEAMGLAVIVVLLVIGVGLFLYFSLDTGSDVTQRYKQDQTSQNMVNALLETSIPDCSLNFEGLVRDTLVYQRNSCGSSNDTMTAVLDNIFSKTLDL